MPNRIDAHHHLWHFDPQQYPWIGDRMHVLRHDFLPPDLHKEMIAAGITGSIAVQARQTIEETQWLLQLAEQNDFIKGVVGWVPLADDEVALVLDQFVHRHPKLRAIRHVLQDEPDENHILREDFNRGIRELTRHNLTYDILIFERHLPQTIKFVDRYPNQKFVVDHLAKPRVKYKAISPWREHIHELAKRPNVYCKLSGLATEADHQHWTEQQLHPYMETVLSAFGPKRLMFGSDWPVCLLAITYQRWVHIVESFLTAQLSPSEQQHVWSQTAVEAYRLNTE
jgi:L-fuconolactonase